MRTPTALCLVLVTLAACSDDPAPARLAVRVVDGATGSPVAGARLFVESLDQEVGQVARGVTDDAGEWLVTVPEPGTYVVGNLHLVDDLPCWWDIPRTEVIVTEGTIRLDFEALRACR